MPKLEKVELSPHELESMKAYAMEFLLKDIDSLRQFVKRMREDFGQNDLTFMLKMFALNSNKAFNVAEYMKEQSRQAKEYIDSLKKDFSPDERRAALNNWVEANASKFRKRIIFKQMLCIDKMSDEIVPIIKEALEK